MRRTLAVLVSLAALVAGCGGDDATPSSADRSLPGTGRPSVALGTKNFTEQFILGELYAQALRAKGFTVRLKPNIGSSEIIDRTLTGGQIDLYPEYIGVIAVELAGQDPPRTRTATYEAARRFEARRGFELLRPTPFQDALALAVKPGFARRNGLRELGDLRRLDSFTYGGAPENRTRYQGLKGMRQAYGLTNARFRVVQLGDQYEALDSGRFDVVNVLTTDGQLERGEYTVLDDPKGIFGFQNVAPVVNRGVLRRMGPAFEATLNEVSSRLTDEVMQKMNGAVDIDGKRPADVARAFLRRAQLL